jgi:hypothetical protein
MGESVGGKGQIDARMPTWFCIFWFLFVCLIDFFFFKEGS